MIFLVITVDVARIAPSAVDILAPMIPPNISTVIPYGICSLINFRNIEEVAASLYKSNAIIPMNVMGIPTAKVIIPAR